MVRAAFPEMSTLLMVDPRWRCRPGSPNRASYVSLFRKHCTMPSTQSALVLDLPHKADHMQAGFVKMSALLMVDSNWLCARLPALREAPASVFPKTTVSKNHCSDAKHWISQST